MFQVIPNFLMIKFPIRVAMMQASGATTSQMLNGKPTNKNTFTWMVQAVDIDHYKWEAGRTQANSTSYNLIMMFLPSQRNSTFKKFCVLLAERRSKQRT